MKVKVVNKDKFQIVEIPADQVLVISDKRTMEAAEQEVLFTPIRFVDTHEGIPEFEVDKYGAVCFFYDPVVIVEVADSEEHHEALFSTGTFMWVSVGKQFVEEGKHTEAAYSREEGEATIVTTPRGYIQLQRLSEEEKKDEDRGNFRSKADLGSFGQGRGGRLDDAIFEQIRSFINAPRESGKDYSEHTPSEWNPMFMFGALQDPRFKDNRNSTLPGYWHNIALIGF